MPPTDLTLPVAATTRDCEPSVWLGATAPGGLGLPLAMPTDSQLYAPRGVWLDDDLLIVADTGNHRVMIWHGPPTADHAAADVVLGQRDFTHEGAQSDGRGPDNGMRLPTGVIVVDGRLLVADAWNHRILVWNEVPQRNDVAPDVVIGQPDRASVDENRGGACGPLGFYWPFGLAMVAGRFCVTDTGNRRVLVWDGIPEPEVAPEVIIGQLSAYERDENGGELDSHSFRWPHDVAGTAETLLIADAGNHRVLGWNPHPAADVPASMVLGQTDFVSGAEFPYIPQTPTSMRFPYAIDIADGMLAVADTANNRILLWDEVPTGSTTPADHVLGQPNFAKNGENRWDQVAHDTFCWPYGIHLHTASDGTRRLAVADSGNNRAMVWTIR